MKTLFSILAVSSLLAIAPQAQASITYDLVVGSVGAGSVSGTITTDGALGSLAPSDITDWDINLNPNPGTAFGLLGPSSGNNSALEYSVDSVFTTSTALYFDFGGPGDALFQNPTFASAINYFCLAGSGVICGGSAGPAINDGTTVFGANTQSEPATMVLIAAVPGTATPEPRTLGILSLSLMGLGLIRRFRS